MYGVRRKKRDRELERLLGKRGKISEAELNKFLQEYQGVGALDLADPKLRALFRKAGLELNDTLPGDKPVTRKNWTVRRGSARA